MTALEEVEQALHNYYLTHGREATVCLVTYKMYKDLADYVRTNTNSPLSKVLKVKGAAIHADATVNRPVPFTPKPYPPLVPIKLK